MKIIGVVPIIVFQLFLITACENKVESVKSSRSIKNKSNSKVKNLPNVVEEKENKTKSKNITRIDVSSGNLSVSPPYQFATSIQIKENELLFEFMCGKGTSLFGDYVKLSKKLKKIIHSEYDADGMISGEGKFQLHSEDWKQVLNIVNAEKLVNQDPKDVMVGASSSTITLYSGEEIIYSGDDASSSLSDEGLSVMDKVFSWSEKFIQNYRLN